MEKFEDVYDRWERRQLNQAEAAELLGKSERTFRRCIDRLEARVLSRRRQRCRISCSAMARRMMSSASRLAAARVVTTETDATWALAAIGATGGASAVAGRAAP